MASGAIRRAAPARKRVRAAAVRQRQAVLRKDLFSVKQQVEVERARRITHRALAPWRFSMARSAARSACGWSVVCTDATALMKSGCSR